MKKKLLYNYLLWIAVLDDCLLELNLVNSDIEHVDSQKLLRVTIEKHLLALMYTLRSCVRSYPRE